MITSSPAIHHGGERHGDKILDEPTTMMDFLHRAGGSGRVGQREKGRELQAKGGFY